jgi:GT2 family glycosyltransferase
MEHKPVSIIILYYHRDPKLMPDNYDPYMMQDLVESIELNTSNYELITVDNGSTIDEYDWLKGHVHKHHRFEKNEGISNGWNKGLSLATHENMIILGDDTIVPPNWVEEMLKAIEMPDAGAATVHVEGMPYGEGIKETWKWFPGACFMLTKKTIEKVGYFDWNLFYPCNWEDASMWCRIMGNGLKLYTNYAVTVRHRMGATLHVDDLSSPFEKLRQVFIKRHGFDCQPYLYGDKDIREVLHLVNKDWVPLNDKV